MFALFLGLFFLGIDPPEYVGKYVSENEIETENKSLKHIFLMLKNGDLTSPILRDLTIKTIE